MMYLTKTDGATFDKDAKACFDRIIPTLTKLRRQQLGIPKSARNMHSELLRKASYVLKTGAGISEQAYSWTEDQPLYGEGQGTKWATVAWVIISTRIMALMPKRVDGIQFKDRTSVYSWSKSWTDSSMTPPYGRTWHHHMAEPISTPQRSTESTSQDASIQGITARLQISAQWWEQLLHATADN
jgi:hypothetical protein